VGQTILNRFGQEFGCVYAFVLGRQSNFVSQ